MPPDFFFVSKRATALTKQIYRASLRLINIGVIYTPGHGIKYGGIYYNNFQGSDRGSKWLQAQNELKYIKDRERKLTKEISKVLYNTPYPKPDINSTKKQKYNCQNW